MVSGRLSFLGHPDAPYSLPRACQCIGQSANHIVVQPLVGYWHT